MDVALGDVGRKVGLFHQAANAANRAAMPITIVAFGDPTIEVLRHYRDLGVARVVLGGARAGWADSASTIPFIDRYARLVPELA
jgi:hypothetical protein